MKNLSWKEVWQSGPGPRTRKETALLIAKGACMGAADLVPGVSGGTVAFITGIYEDLLGAVTSINKDFFKSLVSFNIKEAFSKIHLRFIFILFIGLLTAMFSLAKLMHFLMNNYPIQTWGLFFGLIMASIIVVFKKLENPKEVTNIISIAAGAIFAYVVVGLIPVTTPFEYWFIFLCGVIGITAMILPGISGSFLLLILGKYEFITGALKAPFVGNNFVTLLVFACGTLTGLLSFSRVLKWLLEKYHSTMMAVLTGIMIGSMRKVWPWKEVLESKVIRGKVRVLRDQNILPTEFNNEVVVTIALIVIGLVVVLIVDKNAQKH